MKPFLLLATAWVVLSAEAAAQTSEISAPKRHYINLGYASQKIEPEGGETLKSDNGGAVEFGSTFFFNNKKPILGMGRVGLDFSYLDLQYATFKAPFSENENAHFANIGMQIGPSVTVTPVRHVHAHAYVHYAPSFSAYLPNGDLDTIYGGYAGYMTFGLKASYRFLTLGVESRSGSSDWSSIVSDDDGEGDGGKQKVDLPSTRVILGFRF